MRAIEVPRHGDASVLTPTERPRPTPGPGEVAVDVVAAGVNFADVAKRRGEYPDGPEPPYVPGIEVAGRVAATGQSGTTAFAVGDGVAAYVDEGGYAGRVVADAGRTFAVPEGVGLQAAAALPIQWLTAHNALFEWGGLTDGERVLVLAGAGGVGSAAVQLAATRDVHVLATASTPAKRSFAVECGADDAIGYDELAGAVASATDGEGVDLVLDGVGGEAFDESLDALAHGGRIVAYGLASGDVPRVSTPQLLFGNHAVVGYHLGRAVEHEPERAFGAVEAVADLLDAGDVEVRIDRTLPLERAADAHEHMEARETRGKVLLEP